jgi:predicted metal-dependent hydrolase
VTIPLNADLPAYDIRISARARHPQIRILPPERVEVVLPQGAPASLAASLIASKQAWIRRKLAHFAALQAAHVHTHTPASGTATPTHPAHIDLPALDRRLPVAYRPTGAAGVRAIHGENGLTLSGAVDDAPRVRAALRRWLLTTAKEELPPLLQRLASRHGLSFRQVGVRLQKSRWGSCSAKRHIMLNAKLLCLPQALAHHVMLHELAHLRHLNHSRAFWDLLHALDPDTGHHHKALRAAWLHLPAWLET